ncbi:MAG TPA: S-layer homology domain-containing protein [Acidimicrobiia bacterium]|nr:S-layer homology domain-containing protein [Acidimicrobiia bacterium]
MLARPKGRGALPRRFATIIFTAVLTVAGLAPATAASSSADLSPQAIDTSNRTEVAESFRSQVLNPSMADGMNVGWTGDLAGCHPGTISTGFRNTMLQQINWFRQMVGSAPITFDASLSNKAQEAALVMAANDDLSHYPTEAWECWTETALEAASSSNLSIEWGWTWDPYLGDQVADYVMDAGNNNTAVGHRNWILLPLQRPFGFGAVFTSQVATTAMWVLPNAGYSPSHRWVPWPAEGYVPDLVVYPRWNLSYDGSADFSNAQVTMKWGQKDLPVQVISRAPAAFMNQVVWELADPSSLPGPRMTDNCAMLSQFCASEVDASGGDIPIDVTVSGILINGVETTHSYRVTIFDTGSSAPPPSKGTFSDDDGSVFEADIEKLAASGITRGCNPPVNDRFCPDDRVTRGQMAAFLHRALPDLAVTASANFTDTAGSVFEADVAWLAGTGVTRGCNPPANDRFCPGDYVTRGQMAAFLVRALGLPPGSSTFTDTSGSVFARDIAALADAGITRGCNPPANDRFCPGDYVTRGQMAAFLVRAGLTD